MLLNRAYRYALRTLGAVWPRIFLWAVAIPWLRIRRVVRKPFTVQLAFRSAAVMDGSRLCKVALSRKSTIGNEYRNFAAASRKWPRLLAIFPDLRFESDWLVTYLTMPRYHPVALESSLEYASITYRQMRGCSNPDGARLAVSASPELLAGMDIFAELYDGPMTHAIRTHVEAFLATGDYHLGFAHGDFHSRNIVLDDLGAPRLVDLDCVRLNGIQELDALYFSLEWEWSRSGRPWHETIVDMLQGTASKEQQAMLKNGFDVVGSFGLAATYLVDRVGQEGRNFGTRWYTRAALDPAISKIGTVQGRPASA
jgi:hypothetical protein